MYFPSQNNHISSSQYLHMAIRKCRTFPSSQKAVFDSSGIDLPLFLYSLQLSFLLLYIFTKALENERELFILFCFSPTLCALS